MPFIEESDLLELHKDIDKAQIINERLLDQIKLKNKELKRSRLQRNIFAGITVLFLIGALAVTSFTMGLSSRPQAEYVSQEESERLKEAEERVANLRKQNEELQKQILENISHTEPSKFKEKNCNIFVLGLICRSSS